MKYYPCHNCQNVNEETSTFCRGCGKALQSISPNDFESLLQRIKSERLDGDIETAMFNNQLGVEWGVTSLKNHPHRTKTKYAYELPIKEGITLIQGKDYSCVNVVSFESEINIYDYIRADAFKYFTSDFSFQQTICYFQNFPHIGNIESNDYWDNRGGFSMVDIFEQYGDMFSGKSGGLFKESVPCFKTFSWIEIQFSSFSISFKFEGYSRYEGNTLNNISFSYRHATKRSGINKLLW